MIDPLFSKPILANAYSFRGHFSEAEAILQSIIDFVDNRGLKYFSDIGYLFLAPSLVGKGQMQQGLTLLKETQPRLLKNNRKLYLGYSEYIMGEIYSQIAAGHNPGLSTVVKNLSFLIKTVPFAAKNAEEHFKKAIAIFRKIEAKGILGNAYLGLGLHYKAKKRISEAKECLSEAIQIYKECDILIFQTQAKDALTSIE